MLLVLLLYKGLHKLLHSATVSTEQTCFCWQLLGPRHIQYSCVLAAKLNLAVRKQLAQAPMSITTSYAESMTLSLSFAAKGGMAEIYGPLWVSLEMYGRKAAFNMLLRLVDPAKARNATLTSRGIVVLLYSPAKCIAYRRNLTPL